MKFFEREEDVLRLSRAFWRDEEAKGIYLRLEPHCSAILAALLAGPDAFAAWNLELFRRRQAEELAAQ